MILRNKLELYLNNFLNTTILNDYCCNGLQIEGKSEINNIVTGVSVNLQLINAAIEEKADAIIVHHGFFWRNEYPAIINIKYNRISKLIKHDINLFAYHLPLDIHPTIGNNIMLAKKLGLHFISSFNTNTEPSYGILCDTAQPISLELLTYNVEKCLQRAPIIVGPNKSRIKKIAICTGKAQDFIEYAFYAGADVYISGEISEKTTHLAYELGIPYLSAGHHATERYGVQALGEYLVKKFGIFHNFIDINNPI